jgi:hypothetical protein
MAGTRARATPTRDATPTRSSLRQREKKKAKSAKVLGTVAEDVVAVDVDDVDITAPPVPVRVRQPIGRAIGTDALVTDNTTKNIGSITDTTGKR